MAVQAIAHPGIEERRAAGTQTALKAWPSGPLARPEREVSGMVVQAISHPSTDERRAAGTQTREQTPPSSHAGWRPAAGRPDPVALLEAQNLTREPDLVPVRHGRMMVSPFTFYRGAATIMAADMKDTPVAGLDAQLCGDAHLSNFGLFASPERRLLFDLNDFDETLPGPFEYDVKRMAASFLIAARNNGFSKADARAATQASVTAYREAMAAFAQMPTMDVWYAHLDEDELRGAIRSTVAETKKQAKEATKGKKGEQQKLAKIAAKRAEKNAAKAHTRDSLQALSKLGELADGQYRIVSQPPVIVPARDLAATYGLSADEVMPLIHDQFRAYRATLQPDRRHLLERFEIVDAARKVVGVGSVGTRAFIVLLQGRDAQDPLFLQIKEATSSVLEGYLPKSRYRQHGARVVHGQRVMQAASDIFLGWTKGVDVSRHFYWRQLRDMKGSALVELMTPLGLTFYARHLRVDAGAGARPVRRPGRHRRYLGDSDAFDRSITDFSLRYADQNERDYQELRHGRPIRAAGSPRRRLTIRCAC